MFKNIKNENGFGQWIIIVVLMIGIGVGVWVAQIRTNYFPQAASPEEKIVQPAIISLSLADSESVVKGADFLMNVFVRSDFDQIRLVSTHLKFDPNTLEVLEIVATPEASSSAVHSSTESATPKLAKISQWVETLFDNKTGEIALTGLSEDGSLQTDPKQPPFLFTQIRFKLKTNTESTVEVKESSQLLRTADSSNILIQTLPLKVIPNESSKEAVIKKK